MTISNGWIDVHAHFSPPSSPEKLEATSKGMRSEAFMIPEPYVWNLRGQLEYMNQAGIQMQLLSNIPREIDALRASNDYAASIVKQHPTRFGLLAALPTSDPSVCFAEIKRASQDLCCDGFAVTMHYNDVYLSDPSLHPVWEELNARKASVFMHPNAYAPATFGRPTPLIEVAFETCRTLTDMVYSSLLLRFPDINFIAAHCGGAFPGALRDDLAKQMKKLYVDTAATATIHTLAPVIAMCGHQHIIYGSDSGVPCSTVKTLEANRHSLLSYEGLTKDEVQAVGRRALELFPSVGARLKDAGVA